MLWSNQKHCAIILHASWSFIANILHLSSLQVIVLQLETSPRQACTHAHTHTYTHTDTFLLIGVSLRWKVNGTHSRENWAVQIHTRERKLIPTEKKIDFFRTQGDQKAYYNWFVNVAPLTHPLFWAHRLHADTVVVTNTNSSATGLSYFRGSGCVTRRCCCVFRCVVQQSTEDNFRKRLLGLSTISTENKKWGCHMTTDLGNADTEEERVQRLEKWDMKIIFPLWRLIIIYAPGSFLSWNQINHHRSP